MAVASCQNSSLICIAVAQIVHIQDSSFYVLCDTFYCFRILCDNGVLEVLSVSYILLWELLAVVRNYAMTICALHAEIE